MLQLFALLLSVGCLADYISTEKRTEVPFPETIWLGGLIPYKLDKSFKIIGMLGWHDTYFGDLPSHQIKLLANEGYWNFFKPSELKGSFFCDPVNKVRHPTDFTMHAQVSSPECALKEELPINFTDISAAPLQPTITLEGVLLKPSGKRLLKLISSDRSEVSNDSSMGLEPLANITEQDELSVGEVDPNVSALNTEISAVAGRSPFSDGENSTKDTHSAEISQAVPDAIEGDSINENEAANDELKEGVNSYILMWDTTAEDVLSNRTDEFGTKITLADLLEQSTDKVISSSIEETTEASKRNVDCSRVEQLLSTPDGNESIFERALREATSEWQPSQKAPIKQLIREVHHIMTLNEVDNKVKLEAIQRFTASDLARNIAARELLMPTWIPGFGTMHDFFTCVWQMKLQ